MENAMTLEGARRLHDRAPLPVDPARRIAIKRDVHEFVVDTDAATFARAFQDVLTAPDARFGLIRVKRPGERIGRDFEVGERFQGCFSVHAALTGRLAEGGRLRRWADGLLGTRPAAWLARVVEDLFLSDYGEVTEIVLDPAPGEPYRLHYRYLAGTPIAGSTTFLVEPRSDGRCRLVQVFEYQEIGAVALSTFQRVGLKMHDQVVYQQVHAAARRAGVNVLDGTIPMAYAA